MSPEHCAARDQDQLAPRRLRSIEARRQIRAQKRDVHVGAKRIGDELFGAVVGRDQRARATQSSAARRPSSPMRRRRPSLAPRRARRSATATAQTALGTRRPAARQSSSLAERARERARSSTNITFCLLRRGARHLELLGLYELHRHAAAVRHSVRRSATPSASSGARHIRLRAPHRNNLNDCSRPNGHVSTACAS